MSGRLRWTANKNISNRLPDRAYRGKPMSASNDLGLLTRISHGPLTRTSYTDSLWTVLTQGLLVCKQHDDT